MIQQLINIPRDEHFYLACSGGVDSMAIADFYKRGGKNFTLAHYHHGTPQADQYLNFLRSWSVENKIPLVHAKLTDSKPSKTSPEEFWRINRYKFLNSLPGKVVTCHHLNDVAETWLFSSIHGNPKLISRTNKNVVRPFLTTTKETLLQWAINKKVEWVEDETNMDVHYPRNRIRHHMMDEALQVNPGFLSVIKKKLINEK